MSSTIFTILKKLDDAKVHYFIQRHRYNTIDITATFVGKRLEISVFDDGHVEVSEFKGDESVLDEDVIYREIINT